MYHIVYGVSEAWKPCEHLVHPMVVMLGETVGCAEELELSHGGDEYGEVLAFFV